MVSRSLQKFPLLVAVIFVTAVLVLAMQLITPSPVMVSFGEHSTQTTSVGQYFTYEDVSVAVVSALLCGASATYLLLHDREHDPRTQSDTHQISRSESSRDDETPTASQQDSATRPAHERWEETADRLTNNEETIYTLLVEADGRLPQRDLVENTDLSKATVSRTLDKLEHRELVERKRSGMGNTIHLR